MYVHSCLAHSVRWPSTPSSHEQILTVKINSDAAFPTTPLPVSPELEFHNMLFSFSQPTCCRLPLLWLSSLACISQGCWQNQSYSLQSCQASLELRTTPVNISRVESDPGSPTLCNVSGSPNSTMSKQLSICHRTLNSPIYKMLAISPPLCPSGLHSACHPKDVLGFHSFPVSTLACLSQIVVNVQLTCSYVHAQLLLFSLDSFVGF